MASSSMVSKIQQLGKMLSETKSFDRVLSKVRIVSAAKGKLSCELTVGEEHTNLGGTLHGGLTATIIDSVSTWAIVSAEHPPGVSTDLNISYMRPAKIGETVIIDAECLKVGKTLAFASVSLLNKDTGKLIAQGRHTKYIA
ncbi:PREDICTED: acyl-coenzyme A thioesterase 13-like [Amphimedon queenslandica]|uniref:Acyl-coenzyme A thioesterase 13 n=1 Tax=Amphimedon queenslandica TaxID=400682 RepID=A0AAN0II40_AMPQE|nr:PREDICTED: acyl-coenzyme A thioesterase 13-like [Amphimedon queenslandica]|eukprot:XP_003389589.1 PREDICTED: acyl-coenzyme A thioesterase 13-like [Amphimedon queenslandica]